jgi:methylglutaconyl-CoA hydratase
VTDSVLRRDEGIVRWLVLNRPEKRNALDAEMVTRLMDELEGARGTQARCLAITGAGSVFSAGADLAALQALQRATREENLADSLRLAELFQAIAEHPLPVLAAVNGHAIAGGAGLAIACDFAVGVEGAKLGFTEVRIGFIPAIILNFVLRAVGENVARSRWWSRRTPCPPPSRPWARRSRGRPPRPSPGPRRSS